MLAVKKEARVVVPWESYMTEFRAYKDDAWYTVCVLVEGEMLIVKYANFSDENDDAFEASRFENWIELQDFKERFRPLSKQVQDNECTLAEVGTRVCACYSFAADDVRFYDALVDGVKEIEHSRKKGEEECLCTFILFWLHGPNAGNLTTASIDSICIVQPAWEVDPAVVLFLEMAREKIELFSSRSVLLSTGVSGFEMVPHCDKSSNTTRIMSYFERMEKAMSIPPGFEMVPYCNKGSNATSRMTYAGQMIKASNCQVRRMEDGDLEGRKNMYMILITNIDKELSPSTITEFLQRHSSISARVFVFPSYSMELYTRGAIMVDSARELQELWDFLNNPNYIITSSTGRPWVIHEKLVGLENIKASIGSLVHMSKKRKSGTNINLKVVHSGSQTFKIASNMRDLFLAFFEHQERLHKRLALEERRIFATNGHFA
ncbi:hypothetical protein VNO78_22348 [Psophocarpus tetragonolobus]|uniref:SAWADEE domain-containing protein n=1 Tax=Psophocarpus tetragonolobus TaxID=3891 RepID=A0AAN9SCJ5_PSOTE